MIRYCLANRSGFLIRRISATLRLVHAVGRGRVDGEFVDRTARPGNQLAAAVGADEAQLGRGAVRAERAFERADQCLLGLGR